MTEQQHPITPPPELVQEWWEKADKQLSPYYDYIATQAARWGADQELEACIEVILSYPGFESPELFVEVLRAARRPKPPSLAEGALQALNEAVEMSDDSPPEGICANQANIIRRALERLQELEKGND